MTSKDYLTDFLFNTISSKTTAFTLGAIFFGTVIYFSLKNKSQMAGSTKKDSRSDHDDNENSTGAQTPTIPSIVHTPIADGLSTSEGFEGDSVVVHTESDQSLPASDDSHQSFYSCGSSP